MTKSKLLSTGSNRVAAECPWGQIELSSIKDAARKVRSHPKSKRGAIEASIREWGILDPITINDAGVIVDGHLRVEIARKIGFKTVPAVRISHLSDTELRAYAIAANKLPSVANYDADALRMEFEAISVDMPSLDLTLPAFRSAR